jgi:hypothetical protein
MEIKFCWALLAVHSQLKSAAETGSLAGEVEEWMVLSRVKLRACVDRLGKRFGSLLVSFESSPVSAIVLADLEIINRLSRCVLATFLGSCSLSDIPSRSSAASTSIRRLVSSLAMVPNPSRESFLARLTRSSEWS